MTNSSIYLTAIICSQAALAFHAPIQPNLSAPRSFIRRDGDRRFSPSLVVLPAASNLNNDEKEGSENSKPHQKQDLPELDGIQLSESELQHEVKKYKAQAELDALLKDPDGPFDLETELKKVTKISPPLAPDSPEASAEEKLSELESAMYDAASSEDYDTAQSKKEEIDRMHIDDCGKVLGQNSAFYRAFSNKNFDDMAEIWLHDSGSVCIHPSQKPLLGANAVLASWERMFESGNDTFQKNQIVPTNIRLTVKGCTAIVTCDEEVHTRRFVRGRKRLDDNDGMELVNKLTATNIFRKVSGKWHMVQHHASWHFESDGAKKEMRERILNSSSSKDGVLNSVEGLLGIPGHEGLGGEKKKVGERKGPVRRVFTGSLSDLFSGGLNDILKGDIESDISDGTNDDDDEDEDDDEEIIITNMMVNGGQGSVGGGSGGNIITLNSQGEPVEIIDSSEKDSKREKNESKDVIRQNCISTLRKLSSEGVISAKHKRVLLTDIITNSAKGEYSLVEVAYDLLCREGDDKDAAEEDFAEQCKVFAASLPEVPI